MVGGLSCLVVKEEEVERSNWVREVAGERLRVVREVEAVHSMLELVSLVVVRVEPEVVANHSLPFVIYPGLAGEEAHLSHLSLAEEEAQDHVKAEQEADYSMVVREGAAYAVVTLHRPWVFLVVWEVEGVLDS